MSRELLVCAFGEEHKRVEVSCVGEVWGVPMAWTKKEMHAVGDVRASWSSNQVVFRNQRESSAKKTSNILREANNDQQRK